MKALNEDNSTSAQIDIRISPTATSSRTPIIRTSTEQEESVLYLLPHKTFKQRKVKGRRGKIWKEKGKLF